MNENASDMSNMSIKDKTMQILEMDYDEGERRMQERFTQLEQALLQAVNTAMMQAVSQIGAATQGLAPLLQQIAALNREAVAELKKPKSMAIENIKMDEKGAISGATVRTA